MEISITPQRADMKPFKVTAPAGATQWQFAANSPEQRHILVMDENKKILAEYFDVQYVVM